MLLIPLQEFFILKAPKKADLFKRKVFLPTAHEVIAKYKFKNIIAIQYIHISHSKIFYFQKKKT